MVARLSVGKVGRVNGSDLHFCGSWVFLLQVRHYYRCTSPGCECKRQVTWEEDEAVVVQVGSHNHTEDGKRALDDGEWSVHHCFGVSFCWMELNLFLFQKTMMPTEVAWRPRGAR